MPFEARKANFNFIFNYELYNLIKSAFYQEIGVYINTNVYSDVINRRGELMKFSFQFL